MSLLDWDSLTYWLPLILGVMLLLSAGLFHHPHATHHGGAKGGKGGGKGGKGAKALSVKPHVGSMQVAAALHAVLDFVGFGRAPALLVLSCAMTTWGLTGLLATSIVPQYRVATPVFALVVAVVLCRSVVSLLLRLAPQDESYATRPDELVGRTGRVVYEVTESRGRVHVYDRTHTLHVKFARTRRGFPPIPTNQEVFVIDVDAETGSLVVQATVETQA